MTGSGNGARRLSLDDVAGSGAITRGAEVVLGVERIVHGVARLRVLKDRDGDLVVGEAVDLVYSKDGGFQLKPKEDLEAKAHDLSAFSEWRTVREAAERLGCREAKAREVLERLVEAGCFELEIGPPGRSPKARCYRLDLTAPAGGAESGVAAESDGQARHCAHCARVLLGEHGRGAVEGVPGGTPPGSVGPGAVAETDVERWRSLLDEADEAEKAEQTCAVDDCRARALPDSPQGLCWSHERIRREQEKREVSA